MAGNNYISVTELNFYINRLLDGEILLRSCRVAGEITDYNLREGNLYFSLKDNSAKIPAIWFGAGKDVIPKEGDKVIATGSPEYYQKTGRLSFIVYKMEQFGRGDMFLQLEERKKRLEAEGIFDGRYKKPIPKYSKSVAVVTSGAGAVIHDIVTTIRRYNNIIDINVINVKVQGAGAEESIINGLLYADGLKNDVVILARGGGSAEELMPFNDETLARVIFSLDTPIISAVGHETDFSISDFAADARAATPTAAAELVAYSVEDTKTDILYKIERIKNIITSNLREREMRVRMSAGTAFYKLSANIAAIESGIKSRLNEASAFLSANTERREYLLKNQLSALSILNPAAMLQKGFFKITSGKNTNINRISELKTGDEIKIYGADGFAAAEIKEINTGGGEK